MAKKIQQTMSAKLLNNRFFLKDGLFSKTAAILVITWTFVLFKYLFATCILSFIVPIVNVHILWPIVFDWADAGAITGAASALYFAVNNLRKDVNKTDAAPLAAAPTQVDVNIKDGK